MAEIGDSSQSEICLSQRSENSPERSSQSNRGQNTLRKNEWLFKYIKHTKSGSKSVIVCRGCDHHFTNRGHNRIVAHLSNCVKSLYDENMSVIVEDPQTTESITTTMLVWALVDANWSLNGLESPKVKKLFQRLNSRWTVPSRRDLAAIHIPKASLRLQKEFMKSLNKCKIALTIEFDHWSDANNRSFLGVLATDEDGNRFLLQLKDVSLKGHFSSVIVEDLNECLQRLPAKAINSIVSDNASTCKKARQDFVKIDRYRHVIQHKCLAHFINLIGSKITDKREIFGSTVRAVSQVVTVISSSSYWLAHIKELQLKKPQFACPVRWYSTLMMLTGVCELRSVILEDILPELDEQKKALVDNLDWSRISELIEAVKSITSCIAQVEAHNTSLGEGVHYILEYAKQLFREESDFSASSPSAAVILARKSFLHYFSRGKLCRAEFGLLLAAYALDRRFKLDYLTTDGIILVHEAMARVALDSGATLEQINASLFLEFEYYKNFKFDYKMTTSRAVTWWAERQSCGILSKVGLRFAHLKSSSADIERAFSSMKFIQSDHRLNMSESTLVHLSRLKLALNDERNGESDVSWLEGSELPDITIDSSLDESIQSENSISSITSLDCSASWLEDEDATLKRNYQNFFQFIDFKICREANQNLSEATIEVSDEQIRDCVRMRLGPANERQETVIVDDLEQMQETDTLLYVSQGP